MTNISDYSQVCRLDVCSLVRCVSGCLDGTGGGGVCLGVRISLLVCQLEGNLVVLEC